MVEPRQSAMQRIQVGVIGLVVVLLFVSLANMVLERVAVVSPTSDVPGVTESNTVIPDEPLAKLGVTPATTEEPKQAEETRASPSDTGVQPPEGSR